MVQTYHRPTTVAEALRLAHELDGAAFLAGGTFVHPGGERPQAAALIDLSRLGLDSITDTPQGLQLGAGCSAQQLLDTPLSPVPLKAALRHIVNRSIRNIATLGGHLGANQSAGDLLAALVALDASVQLATRDGARSLPVADYLLSPAPGLITAVQLPHTPGRQVAVGHYSRAAVDHSVITVAVSLARVDDRVSSAIVAVGGVAPTTVRLSSVEAALDGAAIPDRSSVEGLVADAVSPPSDHRASAALRAHLAGVLVETALRSAWESLA